MVRVPDLLRAAAILAQRCTVDIAIDTGIRRSRVERLLNARTPPRGDEASRILAACGVDPRLLTSPVAFTTGGTISKVRTGSARASRLLPADVLLGILLCRDVQGGRVVGIEGCQLAIDKLTLTFDATSPTKLLKIASSAGREIITNNSIYGNEFLFGAILVQHGEVHATSPTRLDRFRSKFKHRRSSRLDFNPSRSSKRDRSFVRRILEVAAPSTIRISRLDVAVDLPESIRRVQAFDWSKHKTNVFLGRNGVETIYLGVKGSQHQIRIYDKQQQLIDAGVVGAEHAVATRFEAQLRNVGLTIDQLPALHDPFSSLQLVDLCAPGLPLGRRLLANYASVFGVATLRHQLETTDFRALMHELKASTVAPMPHPSQVFAAQWPCAVEQLVERLGVR